MLLNPGIGFPDENNDLILIQLWPTKAARSHTVYVFQTNKTRARSGGESANSLGTVRPRRAVNLSSA
jgi:hypothetical protein